MSNKTMTASFSQELAQAGHNLYTDVIKMALFTSAAALGVATTVYSTTDEASGLGYTAGGATMVLSSGFPLVVGPAVQFRWDTVEWAASTITARYALMYNVTRANKSILVLDFGGDRSSAASPFTITFPTTMPPLITVGR
jgi:hypothetical protein